MNLRLNQFLERHKFLLSTAKIALFFRDKYRVVMWTLGRSNAISRYLSSHSTRKLQIGSGGYVLSDWLNTDIYPCARGVIYMDAKKTFPLESSSIDYIFSEHQIEHLTYDEGLFMLHECWRVLKPEGRIRIATPDLEAITSLYTSNKSEQQHRYLRWFIEQYTPDQGISPECFVINNAFLNLGHKYIYDSNTLRHALEKTGFVDINHYKPGESNDNALRRIENHGRVIGDEDVNRFETIVFEAKRP